LLQAEIVGVQSLPQACVKALVERVASCYQENTYHSFSHACDVTISAFVLLTKYGGAEYLRPIDSITLVVSALMHDAGHPGRTNAFEKETQSELVKAYGEVGQRQRVECLLPLLPLPLVVAVAVLAVLVAVQQPPPPPPVLLLLLLLLLWRCSRLRRPRQCCCCCCCCCCCWIVTIAASRCV
jgi:hypothetical protein